MKIIDAIKIMLHFKGDLKSKNINEKLSGIYWNNFFFYLIITVTVSAIFWLLYNFIIPLWY